MISTHGPTLSRPAGRQNILGLGPGFGIKAPGRSLSIVNYLRCAVLAVAMSGIGLHAQYQGLNLRSDVGVKSGTQPGPGFYVTLPLFYRADYTGIRDENGNDLLRGANIDMGLLTPAVSVTTPLKILGANYGFQVVPLFMNQRLALARPGIEGSLGYGFADMYVQPVSLGWHTDRADYLAAYGFFAPTGVGGRSLDMWGHEIVTGTTVYLDSKKAWSVALTGFYDIYQTKMDQDIRVGDILTIEGGAARSIIKGVGYAGVSYVAQWKMTKDTGGGIPSILSRSNGRAFGVGPDVSVPVFAKGTLVGLVGFRYSWEFGAKTNFEGQTLVVNFTLAKIIPPRR